MPLVEQIFEGHQFVAVFILGVHIVIDSDVAHIVGGEDLLDIKAGVKLVSAKAGEILRDDDSDVAVAHVIHHLLKGRAIEVCSGIAIVHIKSGILEPILIGILLQDEFLERDLSRGNFLLTISLFVLTSLSQGNIINTELNNDFCGHLHILL